MVTRCYYCEEDQQLYEAKKGSQCDVEEWIDETPNIVQPRWMDNKVKMVIMGKKAFIMVCFQHHSTQQKKETQWHNDTAIYTNDTQHTQDQKDDMNGG